MITIAQNEIVKMTAISPPVNSGNGRLASFLAARRHSRRVRFFRWFLPVIMVLALLILIVTNIISNLSSTIDIGNLQITSQGIILDSPRISGNDSNNRSYEITAERAVQNIDNAKLITFENLTAMFSLGQGNQIKFRAQRGIFDGEALNIRLSHNVIVETSDKLSAKLEFVFVDLNRGYLVSDKPVIFESSQLFVQTDSVKVTGEGKVITLNGNVFIRFLPQKN